MYLTWIAIIASLLMGAGAVLIFIFAVKQDYFRSIEETKYQVFWSDLEDLVESSRVAERPERREEYQHGRAEKGRQNGRRID